MLHEVRSGAVCDYVSTLPQEPCRQTTLAMSRKDMRSAKIAAFPSFGSRVGNQGCHHAIYLIPRHQSHFRNYSNIHWNHHSQTCFFPPTPIRKSKARFQTLHSRGGLFNDILDRQDGYHLVNNNARACHRGHPKGTTRDCKPAPTVSADMAVPDRKHHPLCLRTRLSQIQNECGTPNNSA